MFNNWAKSIIFLLVYMISGLVLIIIIDGLLSGTDLTPLNQAVEGTLAHLRTPLLTNLMIFVTYIGSPFVLFFFAALIALAMALQGDRYNAIVFIASIVVAVISFVVLKETFQVARPRLDILEFSGWSFPSGHATVATAFFFVLAHSLFGYAKRFGPRLLVVLGSLLGAILVSLSRLYLGAHWTLDVLGGIALGLLSVTFTVLVSGIFLAESDPSRPRRVSRGSLPQHGERV